LIKFGAKVVSHGRYVTFQMADVAIPRQLFASIMQRIAALRFAPNGYGNLSTPATVRGKNDGKVRPYEPSASLFFAQWPIQPPITRHCYSSGRRRPPETTGTVDFGSKTLAIWGIAV
jgi:hypothetical protein